MIHRCTHCSETVKDLESRAARETCYVSPNGRHQWVEVAHEGRPMADVFPDMDAAYGE
jgi:hypothetical protein